MVDFITSTNQQAAFNGWSNFAVLLSSACSIV